MKMKRLAGVVGPVAILLCCSTAARAAVIACGDVTAVQGGPAEVTIALEVEGDEVIAGTQNDLEFDLGAFSITPADCVINPDIGPGTPADKQLSTSVLPGEGGTVRNLVVALDNTNPIPGGALYTCTFHVHEDAAVGRYTLTNVNARASNPQGMAVPTTAGNCTIEVREAPTPTPTPECETSEDCPDGQVCIDGHCVDATPTSTPTPIGYCTGNDDCPDGQVCVNNMCVTPTPTHTPIGYCTGNDDCPDGQVCVNNMCVTPTPTRTPIGYCTSTDDCPDGQVCVNNMCVAVTPTKKKSGGGGCSCEIDPGARGRGGDVLAVLLPALILALRWRRRRA
jgi:MYXO-CTERM domain-containing protein